MDKETLDYSLERMEELSELANANGYITKRIPPQNEKDVPNILIAVENLINNEAGAVNISILPITVNETTVLLLQLVMALSYPITKATEDAIKEFVEKQNRNIVVGDLFIGNGRVCLKYTNIEKVDDIDAERFLQLLQLFIHQGRVISDKSMRLINEEVTVDEALKLKLL